MLQRKFCPKKEKKLEIWNIHIPILSTLTQLTEFQKTLLFNRSMYFTLFEDIWAKYCKSEC